MNGKRRVLKAKVPNGGDAEERRCLTAKVPNGVKVGTAENREEQTATKVNGHKISGAGKTENWISLAVRMFAVHAVWHSRTLVVP